MGCPQPDAEDGFIAEGECAWAVGMGSYYTSNGTSLLASTPVQAVLQLAPSSTSTTAITQASQEVVIPTQLDLDIPGTSRAFRLVLPVALGRVVLF